MSFSHECENCANSDPYSPTLETLSAWMNYLRDRYSDLPVTEELACAYLTYAKGTKSLDYELFSLRYALNLHPQPTR